jgi:hypothetical protein
VVRSPGGAGLRDFEVSVVQLLGSPLPGTLGNVYPRGRVLTGNDGRFDASVPGMPVMLMARGIAPGTRSVSGWKSLRVLGPGETVDGVEISVTTH